MQWLLVTSVLIAIVQVNAGISSKLDFDDEADSRVVTNSSQSADDDVEVKHTIVVSTKLKNNNRRGLHSSNNGDAGIMIQGRSQMSKKEDSDEVPVYKGFKAVETTRIRTPDTRFKPKPKTYPDIVVSRNLDDETDIYPNLNNQWKPSTFYNNVNYWSPDDRIVTYNINKQRPGHRDEAKFHRKINEYEAVKEFYCCKCRDMIRGSRGAEQRNPFETTTSKIKIDGKLAMLP